MLTGKNIIVIGGNGLIGKSIAQSLAQNNANVIIADYSIDDKFNHIFVDINSESSVDELIEKTSQDQEIHGVINCAYPRNSTYGKKVEDVSLSSFNENVNLHLGGYFNVMKKFCLHFKKNNGGKIINFSSIYGSVAPKFEIYGDSKMTTPVEYAAIKSALNHLTKYFVKYFKNNEIQINTVSPGGIFDHQPKHFLDKYNANCISKGMLDKEDINGIITFLLSDASKYINGQDLIIDDGFTL